MKQGVAAKVKSLLQDAILENGFKLWDITFGKEGGEMLLTVTVDKEEEISMEMLSQLNVIVNSILDEADPIEGAYSLMLESAGAERVLRTDEHIEYAVNKQCSVTVKLYKAVDGLKEFEGKILSFDGESVTVEANVPAEDTSKKQKSKNKTASPSEVPVNIRNMTLSKKAISKICAYV